MPIIDRLKDRIAQFGPSSKETSIPLPGSGIAGGIPFDDEMPISKPAIVFHFLQIFFSFLAVCCFASVASFQAHWKIGPSGLSGFAIFIGITGMVLSAVLLLVPVIYDKYNKLARLARAMRELRVAFILAISGCIWLLLISFITVISAFTQPGCKNPDNDPHEKLGDDFKAQLPGWCRTKKAGSVFFWFAFAAWLATLGLAIKEWRSGKSRGPRDPPFTRPAYQPSLDEDVEAGGPMANRAQRFGRTDDEDEEEEDDHTLPPITPVSRPAAGRPSMDTYGAFDDPAPSGYGGGGGATSPGVSRTMQYADPYAAIRANLGDGGRPAGASSTPPSYEYQGYR